MSDPKFSINSISLPSAIWASATLPIKGGAAGIKLIVNQLETNLPEILKDVESINTSSIRILHQGAQAYRIGSLRIQAEFEDVCEKEGIDLNASDEEILASLKAKKKNS